MGTRKDNGDGSIYQVSPTKWVGKIYLGKKSNGKPHYKAFSGKTETLVKRKLTDYKKQRGQYINVAQSGLTLQEYITNWLYNYKRLTLKPSSFDRLESTINNHIIPEYGYIQFVALTHQDIQMFLNKLVKEGKSFSVIKKVYDTFKACYTHAQNSGAIQRNPCRSVQLPSHQVCGKNKLIFLNEEEIKRVIHEARKLTSDGKPKYRYGAAYMLLLNTGMRMGELLACELKQIDFEKKFISVSGNAVMAKNRDEDGKATQGYTYTTQDTTKTASGDDRLISLNKNAIECIYKLIEHEEQKFLVTTKKNTMVLPSNFIRMFNNILDAAGVRKSGVHLLRHTFASQMFKKGIDVKVISEILGHSSAKITTDVYIHLIMEQKAQAVAMIDDIY